MLKFNVKEMTKIGGKLLFSLKSIIRPSKKFITSSKYWDDRYKSAGNSGAGSYNNLAKFKSEIVNLFVSENNIDLVVEFGCGDGNQLKYFQFKHYIGYDVSKTAVMICSNIFQYDSSKQFRTLIDFKPVNADLTLSLDVIYHLIEDEVFDDYMSKLFDSSIKYVIIYSSNSEKLNKNRAKHVKHREFTKWVLNNRPSYKLIKKVPNKYPFIEGKESSFADFYFYEKINSK